MTGLLSFIACLEKQYEEELLKKFKSSIASSLNQKCREAKDGLVKEQREKEVKRMMETTLHTKTHAPRSLYLGTPVKINQLQEQDDEDDTENDNEEEKEEVHLFHTNVQTCMHTESLRV